MMVFLTLLYFVKKSIRPANLPTTYKPFVGQITRGIYERLVMTTATLLDPIYSILSTSPVALPWYRSSIQFNP